MQEKELHEKERRLLEFIREGEVMTKLGRVTIENAKQALAPYLG